MNQMKITRSALCKTVTDGVHGSEGVEDAEVKWRGRVGRPSSLVGRSALIFPVDHAKETIV